MRAALAGGAVTGGRRFDQDLLRRELAHAMKDAVVGRDDEGLRVHLQHRVEQLRGRADHVGLLDDALRRLRMHEHQRAGMLRLQQVELEPLELVVDDARAVPHQHVGAGLLLDVAAEVPVRRPQHLAALLLQVVDDRQRARARHHPVGTRLHRGTGVGVDDNAAVGVGVAKALEIFGRTAEVERAGRVEIGHQHTLLGAQDLRRLAHEAHARDDERLARVITDEARHLERISDAAAGLEREILNVAVDVEMRDQHGVVLFQQRRGAGFPVDALLQVQRFGHLRPGMRGAARAAGVLARVVEQHLACHRQMLAEHWLSPQAPQWRHHLMKGFCRLPSACSAPMRGWRGCGRAAPSGTGRGGARRGAVGARRGDHGAHRLPSAGEGKIRIGKAVPRRSNEGVEAGAILKLERLSQTRLEDFRAVRAKNLLRERVVIECQGEVVVGVGCPGRFGQTIPRSLGGQMAPGDGSVLPVVERL